MLANVLEESKAQRHATARRDYRDIILRQASEDGDAERMAEIIEELGITEAELRSDEYAAIEEAKARAAILTPKQREQVQQDIAARVSAAENSLRDFLCEMLRKVPVEYLAGIGGLGVGIVRLLEVDAPTRSEHYERVESWIKQISDGRFDVMIADKAHAESEHLLQRIHADNPRVFGE